jgi:hypothetical protein
MPSRNIGLIKEVIRYMDRYLFLSLALVTAYKDLLCTDQSHFPSSQTWLPKEYKEKIVVGIFLVQYILINEITQMQKDKYFMISLKWRI